MDAFILASRQEAMLRKAMSRGVRWEGGGELSRTSVLIQ